MRIVIGLLITMVTLAGCVDSMAWMAPEEKDERVLEMYLRGSVGPYRGRVIDAKTKAPIAGAIVVAVWYEDVYAFVQTNERYYDALEVVTDSQGYFVVDAPNIERRAPRRTKFPVLTIFKPNYTSYEGWLARVDELFQRQKKSLLGTVELESISHLNRQEKISRLPLFHPAVREIPVSKVPRYLKALTDYESSL